MATFALGLVVGLLIGAAVTLIVAAVRGRTANRQMREAFAALASEALDANSSRLAEQAAGVLDARKQLIDQAVAAVNERLKAVGEYVQRVEAERKQDFGKLSGALGTLGRTTDELHRMLASTQRRGAWGERMAEDILRLVGMQEGVNYRKQSAADAEAGKPDFTFLLPNDLKANMDVKFPLQDYKAYVDAETDEQRAAALKQVTAAVRKYVRDVAGRGYIDPQQPTVPYVIVFIPSEQIFSLVLQAAPDLMDEALGRRVVLASPLTLFALLAVMRQAAEHANLLKTADEVIVLLEEFCKEWGTYKDAMSALGTHIERAARQFEVVSGTRTSKLEKKLDKIEQLRGSRGLPKE